MIARRLKLLKSNSFFLFGARGVGKSTLLGKEFPPEGRILLDLLDADLYAKLLSYPSELSALIQKPLQQNKWIIIDEVQKIPALLDVVHYHIEQHNGRFGLSGSSARKLRRGASNLLAGRAFTLRLYPLTMQEMGERFDLARALCWGTLPALLKFTDDQSRSLYLQSYTETYLKEEIIAEQIIRNLPPFRRFLQVVAQMNAAIINYASIASDAATHPSNVKQYFQVLEDTLLGFFLEPYETSIRKRIRRSPKFYLIDCGIQRALAGHLDVPLKESTYEFGRLFETFVINQIRTHLEYSFKQYRLSYLLTNANAEVDLIIERAGQPTLVLEIKSAKDVREAELRTLTAIGQDIANSKAICLCRTKHPKTYGRVEVLPWEQIFELLQ